MNLSGGRQGGSMSTLPLAAGAWKSSRYRGGRRARSIRRVRDQAWAGFTVVEWVVVVAIVGLFASLTVPDLFRLTRSLRVDLASR